MAIPTTTPVLQSHVPLNQSRPGVEQSQPSDHALRQPSTLQNLKSAAAGIHVSANSVIQEQHDTHTIHQGVGETLRGTLNTSVEKHFGANAQAMDENKAALEAGRYEMENRRFYRPRQYRQQNDDQPTATAPLHDVACNDQSRKPAAEMNGTDGGKTSRLSKLGNLFSKGLGHSSSHSD